MWGALSCGPLAFVAIVIVSPFDYQFGQRKPFQPTLLPLNRPAFLITRNHDRCTGAFAFGKLTSGSHADLQLF
jgi:hypothetical protein